MTTGRPADATFDSVANFTLEERDRRWAAVRDAMSKAGVDYLLAFSEPLQSQIGLGRPTDARYLANDSGSVIFPLEGDPVWFTRPARFVNRKPGEPWISDARPAAGPDDPIFSVAPAIGRTLSAMGIGKKRVAICGLKGGGPYTMVRIADGQVNHTAFAAVRESIPEAEIVDGTQLVGEARYVKSEEEIAYIRLSERLGEYQIRTLVDHALPSASLAEIYAELTAVVQRAGFGLTRQVLAAGPWGGNFCRSEEFAAPTVRLQSGWIVKDELEPQVAGYSAQVAQPIVLGPPTAEQLDLFELGKQAFEVASAAMKPGATWREVWTQVAALRTSHYRVEMLMHGRGLGDDGPLYVPSNNHEDNVSNDDEIRERTVFVLKPFARRSDDPRSDWAIARTLTWGDSVVVTPTGAQRLGTRPHELCVTA